MKTLSICFCLGLLAACGKQTIDVNVRGEADVVVKFDMSQITEYFTAKCKADLPAGASADDIKACADARIADFMSIVSPKK